MAVLGVIFVGGVWHALFLYLKIKDQFIIAQAIEQDKLEKLKTLFCEKD
ncbi:hypothetical protein Hpkin5_10690 [Helicobacter pylori]